MNGYSVWEISRYNNNEWEQIGVVELTNYPHSSSHALEEAMKTSLREMMYNFPCDARKIYTKKYLGWRKEDYEDHGLI